MPEKPEVITVARNLISTLVNRTIVNCNVYWNSIISSPKVEDFMKQVCNQVIHSITTRGKFLVFELDDYSLLIHLRMEGKFFYTRST